MLKISHRFSLLRSLKISFLSSRLRSLKILNDLVLIMLHSRDTTIRIHIHAETINNNDERTDFLRKIYFSHFIPKVCERVVRGELETKQTATY